MIRKTLLTTLALLLLYSGFIYVGRNAITRTGQTVEQRNLVKAEDYRYEAADRYDTLVVGSSMSERLVMDSLGSGCYNLAMAGLSSQAGLQLIEESKHQPQLVYVEANTLLTPIKPGQLPTGNDTPVWRFIREHLAFTRQKYQPVGVFKALLRDLQYGKSQFVYLEAGARVDSAFLEKAIIPQLQERQHPLPDSVLTARVQAVRQRLDAFRQRGTRIVLFEMPVDPRLQRTPVAQTIQTALLDTFQTPGYPFIIAPATDAYQTTDGVHLTHPECVRYTHYLCDQLRRRAIIDVR